MAGNRAFVNAGGTQVSGSVNEIDFAGLLKTKRMGSDSNENLFSEAADGVKEDSGENPLGLPSASGAALDKKLQPQQKMATDQIEFTKSSKSDIGTSIPIRNMGFYDLFLAKVQSLCNDLLRTLNELMEAMDLNKT